MNMFMMWMMGSGVSMWTMMMLIMMCMNPINAMAGMKKGACLPANEAGCLAGWLSACSPHLLARPLARSPCLLARPRLVHPST